MESSANLYLDLMKKCLTNWIYGDAEYVTLSPETILHPDAVRAFAVHDIHLVQPRPFDPRQRAEGRDWPPLAHTMIGLKRLDNLQRCVEDVLAHDVPGDLMETGVWRGGATIFMRAILKAHGVTDRCVWVADSFEGLPPPNPSRYPNDAGDRHHAIKYLAVSLDQVKANFERYGLLDDQVRFLKGWFRDTLPTAPVTRLAVLRLDGDMYESTMDALVNLYPKLARGGYLIVDDFGAIPGCRQAVHDYRERNGIRDEILPIDWTGVYWRRS
jgi:O-methyltransferase